MVKTKSRIMKAQMNNIDIRWLNKEDLSPQEGKFMLLSDLVGRSSV
jgi:hypothetical protein